MPSPALTGLIAATYTPMDAQGGLRLEQIDSMVEYLLGQGITGLYVCGSTGEGMSLTTEERKHVAQRYIQATAGRVPVIVQVGHNSIDEARDLAAHAAAAGADIVSATCPSYFKGTAAVTLAESMAHIAAAASELPFYYYHIPALTGSTIDIVEWLDLARHQIPNLAGLKYTDTKLFEFQACQAVADGQLDIVFGCDEMLLGALATGATAAIGSTYNIMAPLYRQLIDCFQQGDLPGARAAQLQSIQAIRLLGRYPFHSAMKAVLRRQGIDCGSCRLPQRGLTAAEQQSLEQDLKTVPFVEC
ncbi:dihydrodipicolinate synthase family protein [Roseimaritima ulvae]|uniref:N-acetylneuraminate lyase n=1 Tax=Roseimaritima ulvae TaxID=980254 RepID=A0A5B9QV11_9BACT|nr:dihydrodipicolinate synthase family protein [Roseimaritima ulvae]QEG42878.1 N-acetylneuraminate lyase [Roseimaritima ulvae]